MAWLELIKALVLGIVEGITEWLPISSTGHMILVDEFIKLNVTPAFMEMFVVVIQLGAILAVITLYFHKLNPFSPKKTKIERQDTWILWIKVLIASIPLGVIGLLWEDVITETFYNYVTVAIMLIVYGLLFLFVEWRNSSRRPRTTSLASLSLSTALAIGLFQALALIPGTSRSGATIVGGILIGVSRHVAAEFTFFMAIPAMLGASGLKLLKFGFGFTGMELMILLIGMVSAYLVSVICIRFLMNYIKKHDFKVFGYYRIVLGALVLLYFGLAK